MSPRSEDSARLSIGALSRACGIPVETLRTWESRYGFPAPDRKPSGHRFYPIAQVARLRRISTALALGHRAGEVLPASEAALETLLKAAAPERTVEATALAARPDASSAVDLLSMVSALDAARLTRMLLGEAARLGPLAFVETSVSPFLAAVGEAWSAGRLDVHQEHFASERVGDVLRSLRLPLEESAIGPLIVFATLPGETHGLGLQMAALVGAFAGCRVHYLGTDVPLDELVATVARLGAPAVAVSVSAASPRKLTAARLRTLRRRLAPRVRLVVGGSGAPPAISGAQRFGTLLELHAWSRRLASSA